VVWHRFFPIVPVVLALHFAGCATIITTKANPDDVPNGIRVYLPRIYLFVDAEGTPPTTKLMYLPDYQRAYDIKPLTLLAKQDFEVEFTDGQVSKLKANQDTTAIIELLKKAAELGAKAAGLGVSKEVLPGSLGLPSGIYRLEDNGSLVQVAGKKQ